ncbi:MAG: YidC/Oxa1 family insertase periplasmic-domain containing protein [Myxococcales bacterium]|nr:YidC/Oxa1 family insertase periplasmic-domain containing protein [Myxococcales bacterium]
MEQRGSLLRWVLIGVAVFLFMTFGMPALCGKGDPTARQPLTHDDQTTAPEEPKEEQICELVGMRFNAEVTSKGASVKKLWLEGPKYQVEGPLGPKDPMQIVTTWRPGRLPLRTNLRAPADTDQVAYDDLDWQLDQAASDDTRCVFRYRDDKAELEKTLSSTERPYEIALSLKVTNLAKDAQTHRLSVEQADWRTAAETKGSFGRQSEFLTQSEGRAGEKIKRFGDGDFAPKSFADEDFTDEKWRRLPGDAKWVAVSNAYFSKALFPVAGPAVPTAEALIEELWGRNFREKDQDPDFGHTYRARLVYPAQELGQGSTTSYEVLAYIGPKEREVLATLGGGQLGGADLLDLGTFGAIGKVLVSYLHILYRLVGQWGWAICLLTITVKLLLFPLSISQIKSGMAMRRLKPEMDELNAKYKDNPTQKGLAIQELWRKNKVTNPLLGCLPLLLQMPVWWALYTSLQTAVELYHMPFTPFQFLVPDLSQPGKYFVIPILLGISSFIQQMLMPAQGDPMQQKLMRYLMPGIFTVMMLFLPAGLGIYFLTNTWLGIGQQLAVERFYKVRAAKAAAAHIETPEPPAPKPGAPFGKGKSRVQQRG